MGFDNGIAILDGSVQTLYTATANLIVTDAVIVGRADPVTVSLWILTTGNTVIPIATALTLSASGNTITGIKGHALLVGDKIVAQASGAANLLGDVSISIYGKSITGAGSRVIASHLSAQSAYGASGACGTCGVGGKVIEIVDFIPGTYTFNVATSGVTVTVAKAIQIHKWTETPNWTPGSPPTFTGLVWIADLAYTGGSFNFAIPNSGFYGFTIKAGNPGRSNRWDSLCCTWNKATRTITGVSF